VNDRGHREERWERVVKRERSERERERERESE
jgi:hypothetical protein